VIHAGVIIITMSIYLVRHGKDSGPERKLDPKIGVQHAKQALHTLQELGLGSNAIVISSSADRTAETAKIIVDGLGTKVVLSDAIKGAGLYPYNILDLDAFLAASLKEKNMNLSKGQDLVVVTHQMLVQIVKDEGKRGISRAVDYGEVCEYKPGSWPQLS
jgi:phosphohistidine phosphatase SixA